MLVGIGTKNPAKVKAVKDGFAQENLRFLFEAYKTESDVSEQPFSDDETAKGAINRAQSVLGISGGDIGIGLEGGVMETPFGLALSNWGALATNTHPPIIAGGARIILPESITERLRGGEELGPVMDDYCQREGIRHSEGAIGILSNGKITRHDMFYHVVRLLIGQWQYRKS
jgi:inosine/xanthosine triphosphatase